MANVIVYTKSYCPFSKNLKEYFGEKGVEFTELVIDKDSVLEMEMEAKTNGRTDTPQVFINGSHIGNFDDIKTLEATNKLDELLN